MQEKLGHIKNSCTLINRSWAINCLKQRSDMHSPYCRAVVRQKLSPGGSCSPVPGRAGAELQSLPGCLKPRQVTEDWGAHEARSGPSEWTHLVELGSKGWSYGEPFTHNSQVEWSRAIRKSLLLKVQSQWCQWVFKPKDSACSKSQESALD